jgi:ubiquinone biosynthesis accessory factor UbiK
MLLYPKDTAMPKDNFLKHLASQLTEALPEQLHTLKKDFEKICPRILSKTFAKFDLITREEFDAQTKVLARTRKKIEELEECVNKLEAELKRKKKS